MLWDFQVFLGDSPAVELDNVQQVSINAGRQALLDNFSAATAQISIRYPNGYSSPISGLTPGAVIVVKAVEMGTATPVMTVFNGFVSDVQVSYGIPYKSGVGPADYLTISCESALARLSRASGNGYGMAANSVVAQIVNMYDETNVPYAVYGASTFSDASGTIVSGSWAEWLNQLAATFAGRIVDGDAVVFAGYDPTRNVTSMAFSDSPSGDDVQYVAIEFDSLAQNYFTQVTVDPESYAAVTVSNIPAGETARNYTVNTYNGSDAQTVDLANFYLNQFSTPTLGISSLTVNMNDDTAAGLQVLWADIPVADTPQAMQVNVEFRGQTFPCVIEGFTFSATPQSQMVTFYLSDASLNNFLVLNNPTLGRLDYNRLGF